MLVPVRALFTPGCGKGFLFLWSAVYIWGVHYPSVSCSVWFWGAGSWAREHTHVRIKSVRIKKCLRGGVQTGVQKESGSYE